MLNVLGSKLTVEEERAIQTDLFLYTRSHSRNIFQVIAKKQVFKLLEDMSPFCGATDIPVLNFWWRLLWVPKPEWVLPFSSLAEAYMLQYRFLQIHLWCDTCRPLGSQHGGRAVSSTYLQGIGGTRNRELFVFMVKGLSLPHSDLLCERPWWPSNTDIRNCCNNEAYLGMSLIPRDISRHNEMWTDCGLIPWDISRPNEMWIDSGLIPRDISRFNEMLTYFRLIPVNLRVCASRDNKMFTEEFESNYRSGTDNSKSFVSKVLLRMKWKFELTVHFKHEMLGKW